MKTMVVLDESLIRVVLDAIDFRCVDLDRHDLLTEAKRQLQVSLDMLAKAREEAK